MIESDGLERQFPKKLSRLGVGVDAVSPNPAMVTC
jgi:hypothetical protein